MPYPAYPAPACLRDSAQAHTTAKPGFRNSEGWMDRWPNCSQRRAPLISTPITGTSSSASKVTASSNIAERRTCLGDISEMPIMAGMVTANIIS